MKNLLALLFLFFFGFSSVTFAQEFATEEAELVQQTQTPPEYFLPYPGLLPDNPLYFIKVARDRVIGFLIHDSLKRAEFNLLQADKRLQAGVALYRKDPSKHELVFTTISKAENYFEESITALEKAKQQKIVVSDLGYKLLAARYKHAEEVEKVSKQVSGAEQKKFADLLSRINNFETRVNRLLGHTD